MMIHLINKMLRKLFTSAQAKFKGSGLFKSIFEWPHGMAMKAVFDLA